MKFERLNPGELLSAIAGLTLLGLMSAVWFEHPTAADIDAKSIGYETTPDAWHAFGLIDIVLLITIVCAVSAAVVTAAGSKIPLPLSAGAAVTVLGLISMALLAYRIVDPIEVVDVEYRRNVALFLGFGMCSLITAGGGLTMIAEGTTLGHELARSARGRGAPADAPANVGRRAASRAGSSAGASRASGSRRSRPRP